jgi:hypothetical protein
MGKMPHEPVAGDADAHPNADTPNDPRPAAGKIKQQCQRNLLRHPCPFEQAIEAVLPCTAEIEHGRAVELKPAMKLPPCIDHHRSTMRQIIVACCLPLRPISKVMGPDHPKRTTHAYQGAGPYQQSLQPSRTSEAAVDQKAVKSDAVTEQERRARQQNENQDRRPADKRRSQQDGKHQNAAIPNRVNRIPADSALNCTAAGNLAKAVHRSVSSLTISFYVLGHRNPLGI